MNTAATAWLSGIEAGVLNPFLVPAHLVALLGLGLMIGQQSHLPVTFVAFTLGLAVGLVALAAAVGETPVRTIILSGAAVAGLAAASGWPAPAVIGAPLALVVGAAIGLDSPPQAAAIQTANAALVGTGVAAFTSVALIAAVTTRLRQGWPRIGVRVLGSWVAASAILVLALRLAR